MDGFVPLAAFEHATEAVIASDEDGCLRFCNTAARRMLGLALDDPLPERCWALASFRRPDGLPFCGRDCPPRRASREGRAGAAHRVVPSRGAAAGLSVEIVSFFVSSGDDDRSAILHLVRPGDGTARATARDLGYDGFAPRPTAPLALSTRERDVLHLIASGHSTTATAASLGITATTVRNHLQSIFRKLGVHRRIGAAIAARDFGAPGVDV